MSSFDAEKVTKEDTWDGENDEGTYYRTEITRVLYDGALFYQYRSQSTADIGGASGFEHTAEFGKTGCFSKEDKRFLIVTSKSVRGTQATGKVVGGGHKIKIDLEAEWKKYIETGEVVDER